MAEHSITLLTAQDKRMPSEGRVGRLLECAPDAPWVPTDSIPVSELLGAFDDAKQKAADFVEELLAGEPAIDGVRHLYALKEILIRAAMQHQMMLHLDDWLRSQQVTRCVFQTYSPFAEALKRVREASGSSYTVDAPEAPRRGRIAAAREHLSFKGAAGLRDLPWLAAQRLFPLRARALQRHRSGPVVPGDWWFYSTFYTFTNIGLAYERALGRKFRFLTELRDTAETPLKRNGRDWDDLYAYGGRNEIPSKREIDDARTTLRTHLQRAATTNAIAKQLLLRSPELAEFFARLLPLTMMQTKTLRRWLEEAQPALVVVGNEAWEGCLLQLARERGIPTVILQHGILGDFYQVTEHSGDTIVVRGEFWKEFLSARSQQRSIVLNCDPPATTASASNGDDLLFVTTDYKPQALWHPADLDDIVGVAAQVASDCGQRLVMRIHPRDSAEPYKQALERVCSKRKLSPTVEFSQGPGLDEVIRESAVALLYFSTVFLDCLRLGTPIVSPGWHDFAFKDMAYKHGVFQFATDLKHLDKLLRDGLAHKLPVSSGYEQFLARTSAEEVRNYFEGMAARKAALA